MNFSFRILYLSFCLFVAACSSTNSEKAVESLQFGVYVKVFDVPEKRALEVSKIIEDQSQYILECQSQLIPVTEFYVAVNWQSLPTGEMDQVELTSQAPQSRALGDCALVRIRDLKLGKSDKALRGELVLGTYRGKRPLWLEAKEKVLQKESPIAAPRK